MEQRSSERARAVEGRNTKGCVSRGARVPLTHEPNPRGAVERTHLAPGAAPEEGAAVQSLRLPGPLQVLTPALPCCPQLPDCVQPCRLLVDSCLAHRERYD